MVQLILVVIVGLALFWMFGAIWQAYQRDAEYGRKHTLTKEDVEKYERFFGADRPDDEQQKDC